MLQPGTKLGAYEIVAPLGAGGMGEVYRAHDTRLGRDVAIKVLPEHLSANPEVRARFEREARTISSLNHPNICTLFDVGREGETDYLVMELVDGETLAQRLARGALPVADVLRLGAQIADALDRAHRAGVIHRDLKPGNVMLTKSGAKLMDFGLARATDAAGPTSASGATMAALSRAGTMASPLTAEGSLVGTFQYMAPEQLEGREADARSDQWALGCVLYEMASGARAYEGATQASLISAIMRDTPRPLAELLPMSPPALDRLVNALLAKEPDDRIQTAHDVKLQLDWIAEGGSRAGVPAPVAARRKGRERLAWGVAATGALASVALGIALVRGSHGPAEAIWLQIALPPTVASIGSPRVSPDGRYVAFDAFDSTGTSMIWVRPLGSLDAQPIPSSEGLPARPFWSPDSRFLAFMAGGKLKKVAVTGGPAQTICDAPTGYDGAWSTKGLIAFDGGGSDPIRQVAASGGVASTLVPADSASLGWPEFLPDGTHMLYLRLRPNGDNEIWVADTRSGKRHQVGIGGSRLQYSPDGYLVYVKDRTLVARPFDARSLRLTGEPVPVVEGVGSGGNGLAHFSVSRTGVLAYSAAGSTGGSRLQWMDRTGRALSQVGPTADINNISLAPDGRRVAARLLDPQTSNRDIWILDADRGTNTRFTFEPSAENTPLWSPDGSRIAFSSTRGSGISRLYERQSNGGGALESLLVTPGGDRFLASWSRDGRYLAYEEQDPATNLDIWALPTFGDRKPIPFLHTPAIEGQGRFAPDARWLAYTSDESGRFEVYVQEFPGPGGKWQISTRGGFQPTWRSDGRELYYISTDGRLMSVSIGTVPGFTAGVPVPLFNTHISLSGADSQYAPSADGQRFLLITQDAEVTPLTVVLNWSAGMRRP